MIKIQPGAVNKMESVRGELAGSEPEGIGWNEIGRQKMNSD